MKKIVITPRGFAKYGKEAIKIMESKGYTVDYNDTGIAYTKEEFYQHTKDADGLIVGVEICDKEFIDHCDNLKVIIKFGVGTDNIDLNYAREKNIFVGRTVGSNSRSVAETAVSYMLADSKNLYASISSTKENRWDKLTGYEVKNKTVGIIGFGSIGKEVAKMAYGLGMNIIVYDLFSVDRVVLNETNAKEVTFEELLSNSDFVSIHVPLNDKTKNLISYDHLLKMKQTAVLINTARGGIVNEDDLYNALKNEEIKGAYFDVFSSEPPAEDNKLLKLGNFYLTPHIGSRSKEAEINTVNISTDIILNALEERQ